MSTPFRPSFHALLRRLCQLAAAGAVALLAAGPAHADFTLNYTGGTFAFGDSGHVGDGVTGSLTFYGTPTFNQVYGVGELKSWSLATTGLAGFTLSSGNGNVLTAFSIALGNTGAVQYYNFAAEHHPATCQFFCDIGQQQIVVTMNSGQLDAAVIQDSNAWSGADAAYYTPGSWSPASAVPEPASFALFGMGLAGLGFLRRRSL